MKLLGSDVAIALIAPQLGPGIGPHWALIKPLILAGMLVSRRYALDYRTVGLQLADRQITLVDLERDAIGRGRGVG